MSKKYELVLATGETAQYARKDAAVAAGDKIGGAFQVLSPSGAVVHEVTEKKSITEKNAKGLQQAAKKAAVKTEARNGKPGNVLAYTNDHGAKRFFPAMARGAVAVAEAMGLEATVDKANRTIAVSGTKAEFAKFEKAVVTRWTSAWLAFKSWKADNREARAKQWATNDGKKAMYIQEDAFLADAVATGL